MRRILPTILAFSILFVGCSGEEKKPEKTLSVTTVFEDGGRIPEKYTCDGIDISPPLHISRIDERARSLAIIVDDPDAPAGVFTHWIAWNVPPAGEIPEGIPKDGVVNAPLKMVQGVNDFGKLGYDGPCPPEGQMHRYYFRVYALDTTLDLEPGASRKELEKAMEGHVIQYGEIMGVYGRG